MTNQPGILLDPPAASALTRTASVSRLACVVVMGPPGLD
jgi:hypothetical protein